MFTFDSINDATGFANGEKFTGPAEVRAYFTCESLAECLGTNDTSDLPTQDELSAMAEAVITNRWWMAN